MELIPFLIFAVIAFNIFRGITKAASSSSDKGDSAKDMMKRLNAQMQEAGKSQTRTPNMSRYREKGPTERGRESLQRKGQNSPWGENGTVNPGARVAANYLKATKAKRKASHKNPKQHGRRGENIDQNRHRTDEWGSRGDGGFLNGGTFVILLVVGGAVLYALSQMPPR